MGRAGVAGKQAGQEGAEKQQRRQKVGQERDEGPNESIYERQRLDTSDKD